jgi:hypothetical protein
MSSKYYLQKVPVESVQPGFSLAINRGPTGGDELQRALRLLFDLDQAGRRKQVDEVVPLEHREADGRGAGGQGVPDRGRLAGVTAEDRGPSARPQHAHHFVSDGTGLGHQVQRAETADSVERFIVEGQLVGAASGPVKLSGPRATSSNLSALDRRRAAATRRCSARAATPLAR